MTEIIDAYYKRIPDALGRRRHTLQNIFDALARHQSFSNLSDEKKAGCVIGLERNIYNYSIAKSKLPSWSTVGFVSLYNAKAQFICQNLERSVPDTLSKEWVAEIVWGK